jgi:hypothetical protein
MDVVKYSSRADLPNVRAQAHLDACELASRIKAHSPDANFQWDVAIERAGDWMKAAE